MQVILLMAGGLAGGYGGLAAREIASRGFRVFWADRFSITRVSREGNPMKKSLAALATLILITAPLADTAHSRRR